jgi:hypothetical protein
LHHTSGLGELIMAQITPKQLEANRQNAVKSTGPKTPEGKALEALNPIKHGLLSKEVLLAHEDENSLVELGKRLRHQLAPVGELEIMLVDRVIAAFWRLRRILRIEKDLVDKKVSEEIGKKAMVVWGRKKNKDSSPPPPVNMYEALEYKFRYFETFQRYEAYIERGMYKALHELQRLQAARSGKPVPVPAVVDVEISGQGIEAP